MLLSIMAKHEPDLSRIFQALSDPTRRHMLSRLAGGALPVTELAKPTGMALPTVLRHIEVLADAGLISTAKTGRTRMCHAEPGALASVEDWLARQRAEWEARLDRLETYALQLMKDQSDDPDPDT